MTEPDLPWQDTMFIREASYFDALLSAKGDQDSVVEFASRTLPSGIFRRPVLDVGCGSGRLTRRLADVFAAVVGLDYSVPLLDLARARYGGVPNVSFVHGDMRALGACLTAGPRFGVVMRSYTSLGYFPRGEEQRIAADLRGLLLPAGRLIVDTFNADWFRRSGGIRRSTPLADFTFVEAYAPGDGFVDCEWRYEPRDARPAVTIPFRLELYSAAGVRALLAAAGFETIDLYGGYDGTPIERCPGEPERIVAVAG